MNVWQHVRTRLELRSGTDVEGTIQRVSADAFLSAESLWLLGASAIIASIGLDVGSAAVIIGAMLISPLMGPILGVGLGLGITDRALLQRSLRELGLATAFTIAISAGYFLLSPLSTATTELVARTRPTLLDVAVAFFGGAAGIVSGSRRRLSMALPGVAIATALMPPLCTAGFGLATGNLSFFFGAFYLYGLNAVFIALSTLVVVRLLRFPHHVEATAEARTRERLLIGTVAVVAALPSMYFLYDTVRGVREQKRITAFVRQDVDGPGRAVLQWEHRHAGRDNVLTLYVTGRPIDHSAAESLQADLPRFSLGGLRLEIVQSDISAQDFRQFQRDVRRDILRTMSASLAARDSTAQRRSATIEAAGAELVRAFPEVRSATWAPRLDMVAADTGSPVVLISFNRGTARSARLNILRRAESLLRARLGTPRLTVVER